MKHSWLQNKCDNNNLKCILNWSLSSEIPRVGLGLFRDITGRYSHMSRTVISQLIWRGNVTQKHYSALLLRGGRFYAEDWSSLQKINHIARWVGFSNNVSNNYVVNTAWIWAFVDFDVKVGLGRRINKYTCLDTDEEIQFPKSTAYSLSARPNLISLCGHSNWSLEHSLAESSLLVPKHFLFYLKLWSDKFISNRITKEVRLFIYWSW